MKFSLNPTVADAFKSVCEKRGLSMASVVSDFMCNFSDTYHATPIKPKQDKTATRKLRKKEMRSIITSMAAIHDKEAELLEKTPENFRDSDAYAETERIVEALETALELIIEVYGC
jgi:hypothetical protein